MDSTGFVTLYHGSINDFTMVDVNEGKPNKDFGRGFYTSRTEHHAISIAVRNKALEQERYKIRGKKTNATAWLYTFEFDLSDLDKLNVKEFTSPDKEWMRFVVLNRTSRTQQHDYDIVIGATANDNTRASIQAVLAAAGGQAISDKAIEALIALVEPNNLPPQFYFATQRAADLLYFRSRRIVR